MLRAFLLGAIAVAGAAYALVRYYTRTPPPLVVPAPAPSAAPSPSEMSAPDLVPLEP